MAVSIEVTKEYGYVVLVVVAYAFINFWMSFQVGKARRKYKVFYPTMYAIESENKDAKLFNCVQRGHQNSLEMMPMFFVMLLIGGLQHPLIAAGLGALYTVARFFYFKGYATGVPENRLKIGVWFASCFGLKVEGLVHQGYKSVQETIHYMFSLFTDKHERAMIWLIMWAIWKARNGITFNRKDSNPLHVIQDAKALLSAQQIEDQSYGITHHSSSSPIQNLISLKFDKERFTKGPNLFTDAAWKEANTASSTFAGPTKKAGLGLLLHFSGNQPLKAIFIQATSQAGTPLQAEAQALELASIIARKLQLQKPNFLTDNQTLAEAAARRNLQEHPGHWKIKSHVSQFIENTKAMQCRVFKIKRESNKTAHKLAQDAYKLHDAGECFFACLGSAHNKELCPTKALLSNLNVQLCTFQFVMCL